MQGKKKKSFCKILKHLTRKLDLFGRDMDSAYNIEGIKLFKTLFGTFLSIIFLGMLVNYTIYKFDNMRQFNDTNITTSQQENFYSDEFIVRGAKGSF